MSRYIPAPDLWHPAIRYALDHGDLKLQPGQWVRLGDQTSRFYRLNPVTKNVTAFHGPRASAKMQAYIEAGRRTT